MLRDTDRDYQAISALVFRYADCIDRADFDGLAELFRHGDWNGRVGYDECLRFVTEHMILYPDGTPRTLHTTTNLSISVTGDQHAVATSYGIVYQQVAYADELRAIAGLRYSDEFWQHEGAWRFKTRRISRHLTTSQVAHFRGLDFPDAAPDGGAD